MERTTPGNQPFDLATIFILSLAPVMEDVEEAPVALFARDREAVEALSAGSALLIVQCGPDTDARFLLDPEVANAGWSPKTDTFLGDVTVLRKYRQLIASNGNHIVRDPGSLSGMYADYERADSIELHTGDEVQIGKYRLTY